MIDKLILKFGPSPSSPPLEVDLTPITVFVGPNNSGKSKILREIEEYCTKKNIDSSHHKILDKLSFVPHTDESILSEVQLFQQNPIPGETLLQGNIILGKINPQDNQKVRLHLNFEGLRSEAKNPNGKRIFYSTYLRLFTIRLDGSNRLHLLTEQEAGDLLSAPINHLAHLFQNNSLREELRKIVYEAFNKYLVIDPTSMGKLRVRLSNRLPIDENEERGWDAKAVAFHRNATLINEMSDGVKAFCGIMTTIIAGDPKFLMLDEPEAFLHPALSSFLGKEVGNSLRSSNKRMFSSTHSASFIMGCVQSNTPVNIIRLTFRNDKPTARVLPKDKLLHLMRHPLLRSTGVMNALFYESVVVTESDSDRAFYQEINERLLSAKDSRGITNCLFINAQNKQTVWDIVKPLRELGIPAAGVVDLDVLKEGGTTFSKLLNGAFIPSINHVGLQNQRTPLLTALDSSNSQWKVQGGINVLGNTEKEAANNFFNILQEYGAFVVRNGEVESWLKHLNANRHGSMWLIEMFEKMGENPSESEYTLPSSGDVWDFIGGIKTWMDNQNRKGIPD